MKKIRLAYRLVIDANAAFLWDKYVLEDTYKEYLLQQQLFNSKEQPVATYRELISVNEKAKQLDYLVGIAANVYVQQLKGNLHRITDVLGNNFFPFVNYQLDIVNTDITDGSKHKIGITFYSPKMYWLDIVNNCYWVGKISDSESQMETLMFPLQPNLAISYYEI